MNIKFRCSDMYLWINAMNSYDNMDINSYIKRDEYYFTSLQIEHIKLQ